MSHKHASKANKHASKAIKHASVSRLHDKKCYSLASQALASINLEIGSTVLRAHTKPMCAIKPCATWQHPYIHYLLKIY